MTVPGLSQRIVPSAEPLADALPDASVKILPGIDHFGLPKQFGFIDAALEFIDAVPAWD